MGRKESNQNKFPDNIPPQMKIFNMVILILMHFCSFSQIGVLQAALNVTLINDVKLFLTVYCRKYCRVFLHYPISHCNKIKCIRIKPLLFTLLNE